MPCCSQGATLHVTLWCHPSVRLSLAGPPLPRYVISGAVFKQLSYSKKIELWVNSHTILRSILVFSQNQMWDRESCWSLLKGMLKTGRQHQALTPLLANNDLRNNSKEQTTKVAGPTNKSICFFYCSLLVARRACYSWEFAGCFLFWSSLCWLGVLQICPNDCSCFMVSGVSLVDHFSTLLCISQKYFWPIFPAVPHKPFEPTGHPHLWSGL